MKMIFGLIVLTLPQLLMAVTDSHYSGQESRSIKSLSKQDIEALKKGDGMGFAKAAELNHYPGPKHVLDLADELELTPSQRASTTALYNDMRNNAIPLGQEILRAEEELDLLFSSGAANAESLRTTLLHIGQLRAKLRFVHLEAHLRQRKILSPYQAGEYDNLRGYQDHARHRDRNTHDEK